MTKFQCPKCGSNEFVSNPNKYDCLKFTDNNFQIDKSEIIDEEHKIYCRECGVKIDEQKSIKDKKVAIKEF